MDRPAFEIAASLCSLTLVLTGVATAADPETPRTAVRTERPELVVLNALRANPLTAPYPVRVSWRDGAVVLAGKVGTSVVHDMVVRMVIDLGYPVRDDLVIDTAEAERVAFMQAGGGQQPGAAVVGAAPYFAYPPPLFGRLDDPFFGLEPPLVSFPPWTAARVEAERAARAANPAQAGAPGPQVSALPTTSAGGWTAQGTSGPGGGVKGQLQLTVDSAGQVFLTGVVASERDKQLIEDEARTSPGVTRVFSELTVAVRGADEPPPPPVPFVPPGPEARPNPPVPAGRPNPLRAGPIVPPERPLDPNRADVGMNRDGQQLTRRVTDALGRRPALAALPLSVHSRGDVVTLAGKVPTAYEAMLAFRAVEQTPGVRDVVDRLEFQLPDENHPNPLKSRARPEDLEPYLLSQIRRHVGDLAHIDRVRVRGDLVVIGGSLEDAGDRVRVEAILRSIPLLRDFRLEPTVIADR